MSNKKTDFNISDLSEDQQDIIECIGIENYYKLSERFGGGAIYIQKPHALNRKKRNEMIINEYNEGNSYRNIAAKYNLTEVWVRNIIAGKV